MTDMKSYGKACQKLTLTAKNCWRHESSLSYYQRQVLKSRVRIFSAGCETEYFENIKNPTITVCGPPTYEINLL